MSPDMLDEQGATAKWTELDSWIQRIIYDQYAITEHQLRALLRPRPRWMPMWAWRRLLRSVLVLETRKLTEAGEGTE